jgi:hypothetical protein
VASLPKLFYFDVVRRMEIYMGTAALTARRERRNYIKLGRILTEFEKGGERRAEPRERRDLAESGGAAAAQGDESGAGTMGALMASGGLSGDHLGDGHSEQ